MKLSQLTGDSLRLALCDLAGPLCRILQSEGVQALLSVLADPAVPLCSAAAVLIGQGVPLLMKEHEKDFYAVLAILSGLDAKALQAMNLSGLIGLIRRVWDEELSAFFASAGATVRERSSAPSPA